MTSLIDKIEKLIKREKTTPEKKKKDDSSKSSSEILSELFGAFNAVPPKIEEAPVKKSKKSKKKHKKEKKKRSRSSSSSDSDYSDHSHKRKKRKKGKSKKRKHGERETSPSYSPPRTPVSLTPERLTPERLTPVRPVIKCEVLKNNKVNKEAPVLIKKEPKDVKQECNKIKDGVKKLKNEVSTEIMPQECNKSTVDAYSDQNHDIEIKCEPVDDCEIIEQSCIESYIVASDIPMPESPNGKNLDLHQNDLRFKLQNKKVEAEGDKAKGRIQIKNLKFSTVFEETVKKAEEERRKKAEKYDDGECSGSTSSSDKEEESNSQFPKTSDPGGILRMQAEEEKLLEEEKNQSNKKKSTESHKSSRRHRSRSKKRSRSRSKRSKSRSRKHRRRSRSKSKTHRNRHRSSSRSRRRSRSGHRSKHRSRRSRSPTGVKLADHEKKRLLEVARRNAINMLKNGAVPAGAAALPPHTRNQVMAAIQSGGKSVDELTDFCKHLSKKEALGELSSVSSNDENDDNEDTIAFHHPFLVKEKAPIVMNIRGGAPLPVKTTALPVANKDELRLQFPVSSGSQHREKALEWVPVSPKKDTNNMQVALLEPVSKSKSEDKKEPEEAVNNGPLALPAPPLPSTQPAYLSNFSSGTQLSSVPPLPVPGPQAYPPGVDHPGLDMSSIVTQKIAILRKEQEENELSNTHGFGWSKDDTLGQFTGTTGAHILTPKELASGTQAWAKKDQLTRAAPVEGGMGMHLLQKMGWTPGQGLGKEGTGTLQPLLLEVKLDTKGLQAKEEINNARHNRALRQHRQGRRGPAPLVAGGKHPVSLLGEYCSKQKLGPPEYNLCFECGPDHKKNFLFKVKVAGVEYQPAVASANKKQAKADAAQLALQKLGILP